MLSNTYVYSGTLFITEWILKFATSAISSLYCTTFYAFPCFHNIMSEWRDYSWSLLMATRLWKWRLQALISQRLNGMAMDCLNEQAYQALQGTCIARIIFWRFINVPSSLIRAESWLVFNVKLHLIIYRVISSSLRGEEDCQRDSHDARSLCCSEVQIEPDCVLNSWTSLDLCVVQSILSSFQCP